MDNDALLQQQCMTFCAIVKAMQGHVTNENVLPVLDKVWNWTKATLAEHNTGLPKDPPEAPEKETNRQLPDNVKECVICVEDVKVLRSGTGSRGAWTLYKVFDEKKREYTTFAGSDFEIGMTYHITFTEERKRQYLQRQIKTVIPTDSSEDND
jgi:hypothetical protein